MKKTPNLPDSDEMESALLANIRALIESARNTIARGVDLVQVHTNFEIGRHIVEFEQQGDQRATYGDALLTHPKKKCENQNMRKSYALTNAIWTIAALLRSPGCLQEVTA